MSDSDQLEDLIQDAKQKSKEYKKNRNKLSEVKEQLRKKVNELDSEGLIDEDEKKKLEQAIDNGDYGRTRKLVKEYRQGAAIDFDDEEKEAFAKGFKQSWDELESDVEKVRNNLMDLRDGVDKKKMIAYIYGSTSMNKGDIEKVFDIIDQFTKSGVSTDKTARALKGYNSSLRLKDTKKILKMIKSEAE